jgi:hypothetical protein
MRALTTPRDEPSNMCALSNDGKTLLLNKKCSARKVSNWFKSKRTVGMTIKRRLNHHRDVMTMNNVGNIRRLRKTTCCQYDIVLHHCWNRFEHDDDIKKLTSSE